MNKILHKIFKCFKSQSTKEEIDPITIVNNNHNIITDALFYINKYKKRHVNYKCDYNIIDILKEPIIQKLKLEFINEATKLDPNIRIDEDSYIDPESGLIVVVFRYNSVLGWQIAEKLCYLCKKARKYKINLVISPFFE